MTEETALAVLEGSAITEQTMDAEDELRHMLVPRVRNALRQPGATANIQGGVHYTRQGLLAMAGYLNVSCDFGEPEWTIDPLHDDAKAVTVLCTATRGDGVSQSAVGFVSSAETQGRSSRKRWVDAHAMMSMAQTRAQVRALNALLMPAIQQAVGQDVSMTPAEDMPSSTQRTTTPAMRQSSRQQQDIIDAPDPFPVRLRRALDRAGWTGDEVTIGDAVEAATRAIDAGRLTEQAIKGLCDSFGSLDNDEKWAALGQALEYADPMPSSGDPALDALANQAMQPELT